MTAVGQLDRITSITCPPTLRSESTYETPIVLTAIVPRPLFLGYCFSAIVPQPLFLGHTILTDHQYLKGSLSVPSGVQAMSVPHSPIHPEESISQVDYNYNHQPDEDIYGDPPSEVQSHSSMLNRSSGSFPYHSKTGVSRGSEGIVIRVDEEDPGPANAFLKVFIAK
jgi:hypothetical protein